MLCIKVAGETPAPVLGASCCSVTEEDPLQRCSVNLWCLMLAWHSPHSPSELLFVRVLAMQAVLTVAILAGSLVGSILYRPIPLVVIRLLS